MASARPPSRQRGPGRTLSYCPSVAGGTLRIVAGGMNRGGRDRETLAERVAQSRAREATQAERPSTSSSSPAEQVKHVWVDVASGRHAGLLLEWRRWEGGWRGRVLHPVKDVNGWAVVEEWLDASLLQPVTS